ncbi:MAG: STAS domain-containing protein [Pseudomonadota bacterium]
MPAASEQSPLSVVQTDSGGCLVLSVSGRVDHTNSASFLSELQAGTEASKPGPGMVIDLSQLEFITSAGLRGIVIANKAVADAGGKLAISGLKKTVAEVFRISRFDTLFPIGQSVEEAAALVTQ